MGELLTILQSISPLGLAALLGVVIFLLVRNQQGQKEIADNHLSDLPEMLALLRTIAASQDRLAARMDDACDVLNQIRGRLNGGGK